MVTYRRDSLVNLVSEWSLLNPESETIPQTKYTFNRLNF